MKYKLRDIQAAQDTAKNYLSMKGREFSRVLQLNINNIEAILEKQKKFYMIENPVTPEMEEFVSAQRQLLIKHAESDDKGELVLEGEPPRPVIKNMKAYNKGMVILRRKHGNGEKGLMKRNQAWFDKLASEVDIEFATIKKERHLPEDISAEDRMCLSFMMDTKLTGCL